MPDGRPDKPRCGASSPHHSRGDRHAIPVYDISRDAAEERLAKMLDRPIRGVTRDPREETT
jgi:hypothetical protein